MTTRGKKNERGESAVEYGLLAAGIAAAIVMPMAAMGLATGAAYGNVCQDTVRSEVVEGMPPPPGLDQRLADCEP